MKSYPYAEIHIGTDSQNINKETCYTTVIAYRLGSRGVHYIFSKQKREIIEICGLDYGKKPSIVLM